MLEYRKDFAQVRENWRKFWDGTLGRPIIISALPKPGFEPVKPPPWGAAYSVPHEDVVDRALRWAESHEFLGDAVPFHTPSICIGLFGAFLGAEIEETREEWGIDTHSVPFLEELEPEQLVLNWQSKWWERYIDLLETYRRKCSGRIIFGEAAFSCNLDFFAEIREATRIMLDFYDDPSGVFKVMDRLHAITEEIFAVQREIFDYDLWGSVTRHGMYSPGITGVPQCDFGYNIGPEQFDEFALPYLRKECEMLDHVEYHLDGTGNLCHLDSLCTIEKIGVVQWVPGSGEAGKKDWTDLYKDISFRGKGLIIGCRVDEVFDVIRKYPDNKRLCLGVHADNADQIRRLMDKLESGARP